MQHFIYFGTQLLMQNVQELTHIPDTVHSQTVPKLHHNNCIKWLHNWR